MPRYIDAEKLVQYVNDHSTHWLNEWHTLGVLAAIEKTPTADVKEVRHGHWFKPSEMSENICSNCKKSAKTLFGVLSDYCPNCGAIMDEEEEHEDVSFD